MIQAVIEAEVTQRIGAERYERTAERVTQRNGSREQPCETRLGEVTLLVPKLREGSYLPSFLEPRRRAEKALLAVVYGGMHADAYVEGVSTRKVDSLLQSLGLTGIDKSAASRICRALDEPERAFRERPLEGDYPYLWLDATYLKVRQNHRVVSMAGVGVALNTPSGCRPRGIGRWWALQWGLARALGTTRRLSGPNSCAAWFAKACRGCSW